MLFFLFFIKFRLSGKSGRDRFSQKRQLFVKNRLKTFRFRQKQQKIAQFHIFKKTNIFLIPKINSKKKQGRRRQK